MNSMSFTKKEMDEGLLQGLLDYLFAFNRKSENAEVDIRIAYDGVCHTVYWDVVFPAMDEGFEFVDDEHQVVRLFRLPGNGIEYLPDDEIKAYVERYEKEHPNWKYDPYDKQWHMRNE